MAFELAVCFSWTDTRKFFSLVLIDNRFLPVRVILAVYLDKKITVSTGRILAEDAVRDTASHWTPPVCFSRWQGSVSRRKRVGNTMGQRSVLFAYYVQVISGCTK